MVAKSLWTQGFPQRKCCDRDISPTAAVDIRQVNSMVPSLNPGISGNQVTATDFVVGQAGWLGFVLRRTKFVSR